MRYLFASATLILTLQSQVTAQPLPAGKLRYLRPAGDVWPCECLFTIAEKEDGWSIASDTERGPLKLSLGTTYDSKSVFTVSTLTILNDGKVLTSLATIKNGKALVVQSPGKPVKEFQAPADAIVTSAPDWTDTLLLCARYDRVAGGKQTFPALWFHPEQPTQVLKLSIERHGYDTIQHDGKDMKLARFTIELRGKSQYAAWATLEGTMVRLMPLPHKANQRTGLILDGYEKSTAAELSPK
jgi:hypothetical protein